MSVKVKITVWYVLLMALMAGLLLAFYLTFIGAILIITIALLILSIL